MRACHSSLQALSLVVLLCAVFDASAFYNPTVGRFASRDPIEEAGGANVYAFVENRPITHFDRLGLVSGRLRFVSTGRAYRDPDFAARIRSGLVIWSGSESGTQESTESNYDQTVVGFIGGLCNSGATPGSSSHVTAGFFNEYPCCVRVSMKCSVSFEAIVYGAPTRASHATEALGTILGSRLTSSDTTHYLNLPTNPQGADSYHVMSKTVGPIERNIAPRAYVDLYWVYPRVAFSLTGWQNAGFSERASGYCSVRVVGPCR